ncbi:MAG: helix-turn-helix domain-containing protein [Clostridia bacterium]|nr:helix-turn-helix domain-containing protein [Clostridia bacterium]
MNKFKFKLAELIAQNNKNQNQISADLNISKQKLSNWKSGFSEPCIDDLIKLAQYFNVTIDFLVGIEEKEEN